MSILKFKLVATAAGIALGLVATTAQASHFRGGALISSVSASGLLTVQSTTFWAPTSPAQLGISVSGSSSVSQSFAPNDVSDSRFTKVVGNYTYQLTGTGIHNLAMSSCCRVVGPINSGSTAWTLNSAIFWNGTTTNTPILFNFSNVQPEVLRGAAYSGNLGAVAGAGLTLTYDQVLNPPISAQPAGFVVNPTTGALTIGAASTTVANYPDNTAGNIGADVAFSGNIKASDGSFVEFEWLFDGVNTGVNLAPTVNDQIINALIGSTVSTIVTASDDGLPNPPAALSWIDVGLLGGLGTCSNAPTFNVLTQAFAWNTANCTPGQFIYQVQTSDSQKTDFGTLSINLTANGHSQVPEPGMLSLFGLAALGLAGFSRRRKQV